MPNTLDTMIDDAITRGLQQGQQQGLAQAKREDLRAIVQARFRSIPAALEQRIVQADVATLDALIVRAATAERIEDL